MNVYRNIGRVLLFVSLLAPVAAARADPGVDLALRPTPEPGPAATRTANFFVPAIEVPALHLLVWSGSKALGHEWSDISRESMRENLFERDWVWDEDDFLTNGFGHPYQGALAFTAARSSGFGFWGALPYTFASSLMWEYLMETEPPSINDLITTTIGGAVLGEVLHRMSLVFLDENESIGRYLASAFIEPVGALNRAMLGHRSAHRPPPRSAKVSLGVNVNVDNYNDVDGTRFDVRHPLELQMGLELDYGMPGDPEWTYAQPFDHFTISARGSISRNLYAMVFTRGLLLGQSFSTERVSGLWGLFTGYDFANPNTMRVSTVQLGVGSLLRWRLTDDLVLASGLVLSAVPLGTGGALPDADTLRDYRLGPGGQGVFELSFIRRDVGRIGLSARGYHINGAYLGEGSETIGYGTATAEVRLFGRQGLGIEAFIANRSARSESGHLLRQRVTQLRFYWTLVHGFGFGFARREP